VYSSVNWCSTVEYVYYVPRLLRVLCSKCPVFYMSYLLHVTSSLQLLHVISSDAALTCHIFRALTYPIFCAASTDMSYLPCGFYVSYVPRLLCVISSVLRHVLCSAASSDMPYLPYGFYGHIISSDAASTCHILPASICHIF
jgi:hypothetical protein